MYGIHLHFSSFLYAAALTKVFWPQSTHDVDEDSTVSLELPRRQKVESEGRKFPQVSWWEKKVKRIRITSNAILNTIFMILETLSCLE